MKKDLGLLILRAGIGLSMLLGHGWGKLTGGPERWEKVGMNMKHLGITFLPVVWGFAASLAESVGSILIILGVFCRQAAVLLAITMGVAAWKHLAEGDGLARASHPLELMVVFIALALIGPGTFAFKIKRASGE
jgi:putative oxidoreductase